MLFEVSSKECTQWENIDEAKVLQLQLIHSKAHKFSLQHDYILWGSCVVVLKALCIKLWVFEYEMKS